MTSLSRMLALLLCLLVLVQTTWRESACGTVRGDGP